MGQDRTVGGGNRRRVQVRKVREGGWTQERRRAFLDHLAACSNVTRAVKAVGLSNAAAYELRARDPEFAAAWDEALEAGYTTLESMMLERATGPRTGYAPSETEVPDPAAMDSELALSLLRLRHSVRRTGAGQSGAGQNGAGRGGAGRSGPSPRKSGLDELTQAILAKLDVLSQRQKRRP